MQISRSILLACVATTIFFPAFVEAADKPAQIKARQAMEKMMKELQAQSEIQKPAPVVTESKPAAPNKAEPVFQPVTVAPAHVPVVAPKTVKQPEPPSEVVFEPLPQTAPNPDVEKAREALRQKMNQLQAGPAMQMEPAMQAEPAPAAQNSEPVYQPLPPPSTSRVVLKLPPVQKPATAECKPEKPAATAKSSIAFPPMQGPPTGLSATKEQRLQELLQDYKADRLTPDQYHVQRAKILAEP